MNRRRIALAVFTVAVTLIWVGYYETSHALIDAIRHHYYITTTTPQQAP
jgi:hypothetical protein